MFGVIFLTVKTMMGETRDIHVPQNCTIEQLKMKIFFELEVLPEQQVLMYQDEELDDDDTVADYNIEDGATISLFPKVASGFVI